jgi:hypothetical protein
MENRRESFPRSGYTGGVSSAIEERFEGELNANTGVVFLVLDGALEPAAKLVGFGAPVLFTAVEEVDCMGSN